jgi:hypothetical protein
MQFSAGRYNYFLILSAIFIFAELIVNPIGDFPLNDDWSYGKSVHYLEQGDYTIGSFGAMSLFTHLMWGALFVKIFGFSFTVLRISTLVSALAGLYFLNKLVTEVTSNKFLGFLFCLTLLFNPLYFNLANTYMTDVNFNTLLIICCFFAFRFFKTGRRSYLFPFFIVSALLILIRQFGIVMPVAFTLGCLLLKENKWTTVLYSLVGSVLVYMILKLYEGYLAGILPAWSAYKFSGSIHLTDKIFWDGFRWNLSHRYRLILLQVLVFSMPAAIVYAGSLINNTGKYLVAIAILLGSGTVFWLFKDVKLASGNIFMNMSLGPETFYESKFAKTNHTYSEGFEYALTIVKYCFASVTTTVLVLCCINLFKRGNRFSINPEIFFLTVLIFAYVFMILITESYFDRYHIPIITVSLILFAHIGVTHKINYQWIIIPLVCFFYVSVFGTKDYLTLNRVRWGAYDYLKEKKGITAEKVNGGFEINCWNDAKGNWWYNFHTLSTFDYLIQFKKEDGFSLFKEYEFQRYFPYKKDKMSIFIREDKTAATFQK